MNIGNRPPRQVGKKYPCLECGRTYKANREWHYFCLTTCRVKYWIKANLESEKIKELESRIKVLEKKKQEDDLFKRIVAKDVEKAPRIEDK